MLRQFFQQLPSFKGKRRLAKLLYKGYIRSAQNIIVEGSDDAQYLLPNLKDNISFDIFVNGIYEKDTINLLDRMLPPGGYYLDLGANIGAILVPLARRRPDIKIIAVEAAPWIFHYLKENVALNNLKNVKLVNKALFDKDGVELDFFSPQDKFGKGSLSPVFSREAVKVTTTKVDSLIREYNFPQVDVVKVDVEGFEYFVFKGCETMLNSKHSPKIVFEFVDWAEEQAMGLQAGAAQQFLIDSGYELYNIEKTGSFVKMDSILKKGGHNLYAAKNLNE
jgi:FkbM family methyltransferase